MPSTPAYFSSPRAGQAAIALLFTSLRATVLELFTRRKRRLAEPSLGDDQAYRHNEGVNISFFDGHTEYRPKTAVWILNVNGSNNSAALRRGWQVYHKN